VEDSNCVTNSCCGEKADELVEEFGYDAPEAWRNSSVATLKGDVYSFRILVLEIITRLRLRETIPDEEGVDCAEPAIQRYRSNLIIIT